MYEELRELMLEAKERRACRRSSGRTRAARALEGRRDRDRRLRVRGADLLPARRAHRQGQAAEGLHRAGRGEEGLREVRDPHRRRWPTACGTSCRARSTASASSSSPAARPRAPTTLLEEVRGIAAGGAFGSIMGRNAFQRPRAEALKLLVQRDGHLPQGRADRRGAGRERRARRCVLLARRLAGVRRRARRQRPRRAPAPNAGPHASLPTVPRRRRRSTAETPTGPRRVALQFELNGRKFPLAARARDRSRASRCGCSSTRARTRTSSRAGSRARLGLPMRPLGDVGSDHTGRAVTAYTVEHPAWSIDDWGPLADGPMLVTDVPEPIERIGIGAFVSPQWLARPGTRWCSTSPNREMRTAPWDDAVRRSRRCRAARSRRAARGCAEDDASAIKGLAFVLPRERRRPRGGPPARHGRAPHRPAVDVAGGAAPGGARDAEPRADVRRLGPREDEPGARGGGAASATGR